MRLRSEELTKEAAELVAENQRASEKVKAAVYTYIYTPTLLTPTQPIRRQTDTCFVELFWWKGTTSPHPHRAQPPLPSPPTPQRWLRVRREVSSSRISSSNWTRFKVSLPHPNPTLTAP